MPPSAIRPWVVAAFFDCPNPNSTVERDTTSFLVLSLDALLLVSPIANFGFYVGPGVDLGLSGSTEGVDDANVNGFLKTTRSSSGQEQARCWNARRNNPRRAPFDGGRTGP
jgi:hypothetical protein